MKEEPPLPNDEGGQDFRKMRGSGRIGVQFPSSKYPPPVSVLKGRLISHFIKAGGKPERTFSRAADPTKFRGQKNSIFRDPPQLQPDAKIQLKRNSTARRRKKPPFFTLAFYLCALWSKKSSSPIHPFRSRLAIFYFAAVLPPSPFSRYLLGGTEARDGMKRKREERRVW